MSGGAEQTRASDQRKGGKGGCDVQCSGRYIFVVGALIEGGAG